MEMKFILLLSAVVLCVFNVLPSEPATLETPEMETDEDFTLIGNSNGLPYREKHVYGKVRTTVSRQVVNKPTYKPTSQPENVGTTVGTTPPVKIWSWELGFLEPFRKPLKKKFDEWSVAIVMKLLEPVAKKIDAFNRQHENDTDPGQIVQDAVEAELVGIQAVEDEVIDEEIEIVANNTGLAAAGKEVEDLEKSSENWISGAWTSVTNFVSSVEITIMEAFHIIVMIILVVIVCTIATAVLKGLVFLRRLYQGSADNLKAEAVQKLKQENPGKDITGTIC